jgi:protein SCO1
MDKAVSRPQFIRVALRLMPIALFVFIVASVLFVFFNADEKSTFQINNPLPEYGQVPSASFLKQNGSSFNTQDLEGKIWVADFIFTRCAGICPVMSTAMADLQKKLPGAHLVSFSVDPQHDSPEVLDAYAQGFGANSNQWFFLTGDKKELNKITEAFHMNSADDPGMHSSRFAVVDSRGQIRGYYDSSDPVKMKQMLKDVRQLSKTVTRGI